MSRHGFLLLQNQSTDSTCWWQKLVWLHIPAAIMIKFLRSSTLNEEIEMIGNGPFISGCLILFIMKVQLIRKRGLMLWHLQSLLISIFHFPLSNFKQEFASWATSTGWILFMIDRKSLFKGKRKQGKFFATCTVELSLSASAQTKGTFSSFPCYCSFKWKKLRNYANAVQWKGISSVVSKQ